MKGMLIDMEIGDLCVERGLIAVGDSEGQTAEVVVRAMRGEFKESPLLGGEAVRQLGGCVDVMWPGEVREMLRGCGVGCERVEVEGGEVVIS